MTSKLRTIPKTVLVVGFISAATMGVAAGQGNTQDQTSDSQATGTQNANPETEAAIVVTTEVNTPMYVGYSVVAQVEDVRETVGDLIEAIQEAGSSYGFENWDQTKLSLTEQERNIDALEDRLDIKAEMASGTRWGTYIQTGYGTTIHSSLSTIGDVLETIASNLQTGKKTANLPVAVADDVVDQVDDVRETVADLVQSVRDAGEGFYFYDWEQDAKNLDKYESALAVLDDKLDRKEERADEEWVSWFGADVYKVTVHSSVSELAGVVKGLAASLAGRADETTH